MRILLVGVLVTALLPGCHGPLDPQGDTNAVRSNILDMPKVLGHAFDCDYQEEAGDTFPPVLLAVQVIEANTAQAKTVRLSIALFDCSNIANIASTLRAFDSEPNQTWETGFQCPSEGCPSGDITAIFPLPESLANGTHEVSTLTLTDSNGNSASRKFAGRLVFTWNQRDS